MSNEKGVVTLLVALVLPILFFFIALIADIGMLHVQRSQAQTIADSASLAGATISDNEVGEMKKKTKWTRVNYDLYEYECDEYYDEEKDRYVCENKKLVNEEIDKWDWERYVEENDCDEYPVEESTEIHRHKYWEVVVENTVDVRICENLSKQRAAEMVEINKEYVAGEPEISNFDHGLVNPDGYMQYIVDTMPRHKNEPPDAAENYYMITGVSYDGMFDENNNSVADVNACYVELTLEVESLFFGGLLDREGKVEISVESRSEVDPEELLY